MTRRSIPLRRKLLRRGMDARIKSGHDERVWRNEDSDCFARTPTSFQQSHCLLTRVHDPATRCARVVHLSLAPMEGVGNAGCPLHPRPRVPFVLVERTRVTTSTPESPGIPARNGFTAYVALSPVTGLFCHRRQRISGLSAPGRADLPSRELDASVGASGPHDFAVREQHLSSACC